MKKWIIPIITLTILVGGVAAGIFLVKQSTEFREKAAPAATTLTFNTPNLSVNLGDSFQVISIINSGENLLLGAQIAVSFNSNILSFENISKGSFFGEDANVINSVHLEEDGILGFNISLPKGSIPIQGSGTLAIMSFKAINKGSVNLSYIPEYTYAENGVSYKIQTFASKTAVEGSAVDEYRDELYDNAIVSTTPITITVSAAEPTATPTPLENTDKNKVVPTSTPTSVPPTATPTQKPTNTPTPSPTPTSSGGIGGINIPTSTPTPTTKPTSTPTTALIANNLTSGASSPTPSQLLDSGFEDYTFIYLFMSSLAFITSGLLIFSIKS